VSAPRKREITSPQARNFVSVKAMLTRYGVIGAVAQMSTRSIVGVPEYVIEVRGRVARGALWSYLLDRNPPDRTHRTIVVRNRALHYPGRTVMIEDMPCLVRLEDMAELLACWQQYGARWKEEHR